MDPLSITASLIALSQATATSSKLLLDVIQSSKNRDDLIVLLNQLRHLVRLTTEILKRTETLELESNPSSLLNILLPTVDKLGEITYELTSVLSDVNPQEKRKFRGRGVVPLSDKRIVDISSRIERLIPSLTLAMTVNDM